MRRFIILPFCVLFLATPPSFGQKILPRSLGAWTGTPNAGVPMRAADLSSAVPIASQGILTEYGWVSTESANYAQAGNGSPSLQATVFEMKDPSAGYGLYSYLRAPDMVRADFTEHSSMSSDRALVLAGNLVVDIEGPAVAKLAPELKSLVAAVATHAQGGLFPTLWEHLPEKGMVDRTDRYILGPQALNQLFPGGLGDSMGFRIGAEAELAHYNVGSHDATLLIADFPTPQIAQQKLEELQKNFGVNGSGPANGAPALFAKRQLTLLAIVGGAATQTDAENLLSEVHPGTELMWDEPTFQFKEPSIEAMIVGSIVGAGTICLFALIAGVSFGGLRLAVKRFWPGKVFDTKRHLQVLQLGLGSKPINSEDFYGYSAPSAPGTTVDKNLPDRVALRIFR
jgi:hypothetical protein